MRERGAAFKSFVPVGVCCLLVTGTKGGVFQRCEFRLALQAATGCSEKAEGTGSKQHEAAGFRCRGWNGDDADGVQIKITEDILKCEGQVCSGSGRNTSEGLDGVWANCSVCLGKADRVASEGRTEVVGVTSVRGPGIVNSERDGIGSPRHCVQSLGGGGI